MPDRAESRTLYAWMMCYRLKSLGPHLPWYARAALVPGYIVCRLLCRSLPAIHVITPEAADALKAYREPVTEGNWPERFYEA